MRPAKTTAFESRSDRVARRDLVNYGQRFYSPWMGRFINRDPIEEQGGINLYAFCRNDGVNRWDYLGMTDRFVFGATYGVPVFINIRTEVTLSPYVLSVSGTTYGKPSYHIYDEHQLFVDTHIQLLGVSITLSRFRVGVPFGNAVPENEESRGPAAVPHISYVDVPLNPRIGIGGVALGPVSVVSPEMDWDGNFSPLRVGLSGKRVIEVGVETDVFPDESTATLAPFNVTAPRLSRQELEEAARSEAFFEKLNSEASFAGSREWELAHTDPKAWFANARKDVATSARRAAQRAAAEANANPTEANSTYARTASDMADAMARDVLGHEDRASAASENAAIQRGKGK